MSAESLVLVWIAVCAVGICNLIAGGCAAMFHIFSGDSTPGVRILAAAAMGGFVPASTVGGIVILASGSALQLSAWVVMSVVFLAGLLASLPLGAYVTVKLASGESIGRHFE